MNNRTLIQIVSSSTVLGIAGVGLFVASNINELPPASASGLAADPVSELYLPGVVLDFQPDHPDFDINDASAMGHYAMNVGPTMDFTGAPVFVGSGLEVVQQWYDKNDNPIAPYGDAGLFGGHFDVDVFDAPVTRKLYHEHEYDDKFNVAYVDIANDSKLLFHEIIGDDYPNDLRVMFVNAHNGGAGSYSFEAGGDHRVGHTVGGFEAVFTPSELTQFQVDFQSLAHLSKTDPGTSQGDIADRAGALAVRMYDVVSGDLVYELSVYHHFKEAKKKRDEPSAPDQGNDSCGVPLNDSIGSFGATNDGGISSGDSFNQWFSYVPGVNAAEPHGITLTLNDEGVYEYETDSFYPVDDALYGNDGGQHNEFFTYAITSTFVHRACEDKFFEFEGNDDAWLFIDGKKVLDIGGVANSTGQHVAMDRLDLVDGQEYTMKFYYAHRHSAANSVFRMRTNMELQSDQVRTPIYRAYD